MVIIPLKHLNSAVEIKIIMILYGLKVRQYSLTFYSLQSNVPMHIS